MSTSLPHLPDRFEIRAPGHSDRTLRWGLTSQAPPSSRQVEHGPYEAPSISLPGCLIPLRTESGEPVGTDLVRNHLGEHKPVPVSIVLTSGVHQNERWDALWVGALERDVAEATTRTLKLSSGVYVAADGRVHRLGGVIEDPARYLVRLPRIVIGNNGDLADNSDVTVSMARLLARFTNQFSSQDAQGAPSGLPDVCIATGYLYEGGLEHVLKLLSDPRRRSVRLLFSGATDAATAFNITQLLEVKLEQQLDTAEEPLSTWERLRKDSVSGRLEVRVYADAFLHAKLYIAHDGINDRGYPRAGYAVVGSSNVSRAGLQESGNLELNLGLSDHRTVNDLFQWFERRWEEGLQPQPALLSVLDALRPPPPPTFITPGLDAAWHRLRSRDVLGPESHLAKLCELYAKRLTGLTLPSDQAFPEPKAISDGRRTVRPSAEQEEGVLALAQRLTHFRVAFLADSVGLGKTITALGTAAYCQRVGIASRPVLIAPRKLEDQWRSDADAIGLSPDGLPFLSRHELERRSDADAAEMLSNYDLLVVEEAHEALRNRQNRLWIAIRGHLARHPNVRLLLVSATPWNNRREDIFSYLALAWADWADTVYPGLTVDPVRSQRSAFLRATTAGVRRFDGLPRASYREVFDAVFVQRTRTMLEARHGAGLDFPERQIHPHQIERSTTDDGARYDRLYAEIAEALPTLSLPHRQPVRAVQLALNDAVDHSHNLGRGLLVTLMKRAESSLFALVISLHNLDRQLAALDAALATIGDSTDPLRTTLDFLRRTPEPTLDLDDATDTPDEPESADAQRLPAVQKALEAMSSSEVVELLERVRTHQIAPDRDRVRSLIATIDFDLESRSPKDLGLVRLVRSAYVLGHKPLCIAAFADTAIRMFCRLIALLPDARIGLALGAGKGWVYSPGRAATPTTEDEWHRYVTRGGPSQRDLQRAELLGPRARPTARAQVLDAFAPSVRGGQRLLGEFGGEIDILVGSEAISVGQNLQESTCLVHLDLPWNPMVIEQRIGRIDRRGGGRVDPQRPTASRRVIDIHYCWSDAAIEGTVALQKRLREKSMEAIEDTNFDELLLRELYDHVQKTRETRSVARAAELLGTKQRLAAEAQLGADVHVLGSDFDALVRLEAWRNAQVALPPAPPLVVAGSDDLAVDGVVTVALRPHGRHGEPLTTGPIIRSFPVKAAPDPDLDGVVRALLPASPATQFPTGRRLTERLRDLDQRLVDLAETWRTAHNDEVAALLREQLDSRRRIPNEALQKLALAAETAFKSEAKRQPSERRATLASDPLVRFLVDDGLRPHRLEERLLVRDEARIERALRRIRDHTRAVLDAELASIADELGYGAAPPTIELAPADGLWPALELQVLALTLRMNA